MKIQGALAVTLLVTIGFLAGCIAPSIGEEDNQRFNLFGLGHFISQHVAILRLRDQLMPEFVARFLSLEDCGQIQISKLQYGQTKPGLNFRQIRFVAIVECVEHQKAIQRAHLAELDTLFASLQSRAFKGELVGCCESREELKGLLG